MSQITDPAKEFAELCMGLTGDSTQRGSVFLAKNFGVEPWSGEFYQILAVICRRMDELKDIISRLEMDEDIKQDALNHLVHIRHAFSENGLSHDWNHSVQNFLDAGNVRPIRMLSSQVRKIQSYPKLTAQERTELHATVSDLKFWLKDHQLKNQEIIRQLLIDGVEQFTFRIEKLEWLGWGYALESLRAVIAAYTALERETPDLHVAPDADATMRKVRATISAVFEKLRDVRANDESDDFSLAAYKASMLLILGEDEIKGLLPHLL